MFSGFYAAASGMLMQQRVLNVLGNNITNQKTPGYQAERVISTTFDYEYTIRKDAYGVTGIGSTSPASIVSEVPTNYQTNYMEETGRLTDLALDGPGFFNIAGPDEQIILTRNGNFELDDEGYLIAKGFGRVQGIDGDIPVETDEFIVSADGGVFNMAGDEIGSLLITAPEDEQMTKLANGIYTVEDPVNNLPYTYTQVVQGSLTASNIDVQRELTQVMEAQRAFQACSNALKTLYQMEQKSATQIAKM